MVTIASERLYSSELLSLATDLAQYSIAGAWERIVETRSRTCGSNMRLGVNFDDSGAISDFGLSVTACAVGQAAASLFARDAVALSASEAAAARSHIECCLTHPDSAPPDWPAISAWAPARDHPGRHGAIVLPWAAAVQSLCKERGTR